MKFNNGYPNNNNDDDSNNNNKIKCPYRKIKNCTEFHTLTKNIALERKPSHTKSNDITRSVLIIYEY